MNQIIKSRKNPNLEIANLNILAASKSLGEWLNLHKATCSSNHYMLI